MGYSLCLAHLSDLHFGMNSRFHGHDLQQLGRQTAESIKAVSNSRETERKSPFKEIPDVIVVTGDITQKAQEAEFAQARIFFDSLRENLGIEPSAFVFLPGNHDLNRQACEDYLNAKSPGPDGGYDEELNKVKFALFDAFVGEFYGSEKPARQKLKRGAYLYVYDHLGLCVAALNSSEQETHAKHIPVISDAQLAEIQKSLDSYDRFLKVMALHYPMYVDPQTTAAWVNFVEKKYEESGKKDMAEFIERLKHDALPVQGVEKLARISETQRVHLALHGHLHRIDNHDEICWNESQCYCQIHAAGSFGLNSGKLPEEQPNGLRLYQFNAVDDKLVFDTVLLEFDPQEYASGQSLDQGCFRDTNRGSQKKLGRVFPIPAGLCATIGEITIDPDQDPEVVAFVKDRIQSILDENPQFLSLMKKFLKVSGSESAEVSKAIIRQGIVDVLETIFKVIDAFSGQLEPLKDVALLLALATVRRQTIERIQNTFKSDEKTSRISIPTEHSLIAELVLKAVLKTKIDVERAGEEGRRTVISKTIIDYREREKIREHGIVADNSKNSLIEYISDQFIAFPEKIKNMEERIKKIEDRLAAFRIDDVYYAVITPDSKPLNIKYLTEIDIKDSDSESALIIAEETLFQLILILFDKIDKLRRRGAR